MVTLATLENATEQEVKDQIEAHLLKQGKRSVSETGVCRYRGNEGCMCAAGCLISDDEYSESMESSTWNVLIHNGFVRTARHATLIRRYQLIHDMNAPEEWPRLFTYIDASEDVFNRERKGGLTND
jgi:hypothetical protein